MLPDTFHQLTRQLDLVLMGEELFCKCLFCTHLLSCLLSTDLLHHRLFYAVSTLLIDNFVTVIDTLAVSTHFKLVDTPLSNSTHLTIPLQMTVTPLLSYTTYVSAIHKYFVLMTFICTIYIIVIYISTIYIVYIYIFFFSIYIFGNYRRHLIQMSHMVAPIPWDCP